MAQKFMSAWLTFSLTFTRNVYAKTREECEEKLAAMIEEVKKEIAEEKRKTMENLGG